MIRPRLCRDFRIGTETFDKLEAFFREHGISYVHGNTTSEQKTHSGAMEIDGDVFYLGVSSIDRREDRVEGWISLLSVKSEREIESFSKRLEEIIGEEPDDYWPYGPSLPTSSAIAFLATLIFYVVVVILAIVGAISVVRLIIS